MRNCWLAAIAGHQGNAPSNISREGPTGAEGAGGTRRPGCGARGRWRGLARQHTDTPTDWRPPRGLRGLAGLRDDAPSEARGADGSRAGHRPWAHQAARPDGARNTSGARRNLGIT